MDDDYGEINEFFDIDYSDNEADGNNVGDPNDEVLNNLLEKEKREIVKKRAKSRPQPKLDETTITGPKGIQALRDAFKNYRPDLKNDPYDNLAVMLKKYEHWAHVMFPKLKFEDVISRCEALGDKRAVKVYMMKSRLGMPLSDIDFSPTRRKGNDIIETENNEDDAIRIFGRDDSNDDENYYDPIGPSFSEGKSPERDTDGKSASISVELKSSRDPNSVDDEPGLMELAEEARRLAAEYEQRRREEEELALAEEILDDFHMC